MAALPWSTAWRIANRELRSSRAKFLFVVLSVAVGVAALTGVRGFAAAFRQTLLVRARSILAADLSARTFQQPTAKEREALDSIAKENIDTTQVTEMAAMATQAGKFDPLLVALKAVDPAKYPYYGTVDLSPSLTLSDALKNNGVAVGEDMLIRLGLKVGDQIQLGEGTFTVRATVQSEPDRLSGSFAAGPRILLSLAELDQTQLVAPGSRTGQRYLFHLRDPSDAAVAKLKSKVEAALPDAQITDYRETNPAVTMALDRATALLSLVSLVALVLGAAGVAMAMRTHLLQRLDGIAIMKSLGAQSAHILRIYVLETLALGIAGGALGVVLGIFVQVAMPLLLSGLLGIKPELHLSIASVFTGLATGIVVTLLFTLPPLLDIRSVRPIHILRRSVDEEPQSFFPRLMASIRRAPAQLLGTLFILAGVAFVAMLLSSSRAVGIGFTLAIAGVLLVLLIAAAILLFLLRVFLQTTRIALPSTLRHGLANLYRPGNPSAALLAAVGLGVMLIVSVFLVQQAFVNNLKLSTRPDLPNVFLIDIASNEVSGVSQLLKQQPGIAGNPELVPVVSGRIASVEGTKAEDLKLRNYPPRMLRSIQLTWADALPAGEELVSGEFWGPNETAPVVAIEQYRAEVLKVKVGSRVVFAAGDHMIDASVVAIVKNDGQHAFSRASYIFPTALLKDMPAVWYGAVHIAPDHVGDLTRALFQHYPTVTVINVAQAMENLRSILMQVSYVIQFLAGFSIVAGLIILASSIAGTRYRRVREVVVLKTLGGTRRRIATIFSIEFATLGLVAGAVGVIAANILVPSLLRSGSFKLPWSFHPWVSVLFVLLTALLTVGAGWTASFRILGQKPLEVLREE